MFNEAGDGRQIRLATDQGGSHMIHSGNITPIGFVVDGRTGVNCKKLDNLSYEQIYLHFIFVTFCVVTLYQEEEHHQRLLFFVGVPGAGFLWILFGVETGDW